MDKHYISGFATRDALPRNKRMREAGIASLAPSPSVGTSGLSVKDVMGLLFFEDDGEGGVRLKAAYNALAVSAPLEVTGLSTLAGGVKLTTTKKIWFGDSYFLELDSNGLHTNAPFYSNSWISAYGAGSGGSGGGGVSIMNSWDAYSPTDSSQVLGSALAMSLHDDVEALKNASTEVNWVTPEPSSGNEAGIDIRGTSKTLLKSSAIDYPAKVVGLISENEYLGALNTFFPTGTTS